MTPEVFVDLFPIPAWWLNCVNNLDFDPHASHRERVDTISNWFQTHYDAKYVGTGYVIFPNQETYAQCVITWS